MAGAEASASYVPRTRHALAIVRQDLNELPRSVELQITSQENGYGVLGYVLGMRQGLFSGGPLLADGVV
jgi:hypothetical protein